MRRFACRLLDTGPVLILAAIAGAGSFTHIRDTASQHGQAGWMSWAIAVCIDLTCVMAARERQRDKKTGRTQRGPLSWPVLVLTGGIILSLAANLAQADPTIWGWITAATPASAFLIAVSMLERRATRLEPSAPELAPVLTSTPVPELIPTQAPDEQGDALAPALVDYAQRVADEHHARHGKPITDDALRTRLGVSSQLATDLLRTLRTA
ncbi:SpdA protein [[Actinomadura] parvosata subsp. kistnae]|uniref:SpdA protein n=1 Tax=[Actinomadura] parvosata subsp. kistnae TaxID=1909395 RepID=A0A1V0AC28_9ACTN|nr:DUF2637 domain-containing protein [Nonomuraea sp. ATCC 55076]AQZ67778.1 hypothetical protein BKM31_45590 [Nonomuraea sp. ATCC 55076]SPL93916.1 SpdA protein [Actinomadura parvosata subsp. kistnae]